MPPTAKSPQLPKYNDGIAAALLAAREAVMSPIRPILRTHDLTEQQWRLLRVLIDAGPMEISKAAAASMIMAPSVTRIVKELVSRGLLVKSTDANDKRRSNLTITREGRQLVRNTASETAALLATYKKQFGARRFNALVTELQDFQSAISRT
ncbi:MAG: MarR family transcriptional regulator [Pseudomonadales bacterium]